MKNAVLEEHNNKNSRSGSFAWLDFFTVPRARRSVIYANIMIVLGQFTGINAIMYVTHATPIPPQLSSHLLYIIKSH